MRKRFSFNINQIDLLPVFIPIILSFCSWTIYKINNIDKNKPITYKYINPFKINCDFLKPVNIVPKKDKTSSELKSFSGPADAQMNASTMPNEGKKNRVRPNAYANLFFDSKALVNSGYIGEIGDRDKKQWDGNPSDNIFNVQILNLDKKGSYVLSYEVDGYSNLNSVTRSINGSYAIGGYIKEKKTGWTKVSENIDPM